MATVTTTMDAVLPRLIDVDVFEQAVANTNWDTLSTNATSIMSQLKRSSAALNDSISFDVVLIAGTWDIELLFLTTTDRGIFSVQLDGVEKGTIDAYSGSTVYNVRETVSGVAVATTGKRRLTIKVTSKNASSSGYAADIQHIQLRCTAVTDTSSITIDPDVSMPWLIDVSVFMTAVSHVNWNSNTADANYIYNGYKQSSGAQNGEWNADVLLSAGTWTVELLHQKGGSSGICSVQFDSVEKGTIDFYTAGSSLNQLSSVTGITASGTGIVRLKLKMATKNASSANYYGTIQHIQLRRTA